MKLHINSEIELPTPQKPKVEKSKVELYKKHFKSHELLFYWDGAKYQIPHYGFWPMKMKLTFDDGTVITVLYVYDQHTVDIEIHIPETWDLDIIKYWADITTNSVLKQCKKL